MADLEKYVEYNKGTAPIIFSVSHGGGLECSEIPKRTKGILGIDKGTIGLARDLIYYFGDSSKELEIAPEPSYIISKVRRSKIDLNRPSSEAYLESKLAEEIYNYYHKILRDLIDFNLKTFKKSLVVDIHGFEKHRRPEGYRDVELILGTKNLTSLYSEPVQKSFWDKNIRGRIIKKFLDLNIPIAPGHPRRKEYVLTGGYITQQYGATSIPNSQALQIEFSDRIRVVDTDLRSQVLKTLAEILSRESEGL